MPESRLARTRQTLPPDYQFGDAVREWDAVREVTRLGVMHLTAQIDAQAARLVSGELKYTKEVESLEWLTPEVIAKIRERSEWPSRC